jgi:capsular exopolysaccharide synthesis family protein
VAKEVSPYSIRRNRTARKAQLTVLAEDADSNVQDDLQKYWRIIRKHWGLVLAVPAAFLTLTILHDMMATPLYTASTMILIRTNQQPLLENATVTIVSQSPQDYSGEEDQTQLQLLRSRALAERVVAAEGLAADPSFVGKPTVGPIAALRHQVVQWLKSTNLVQSLRNRIGTPPTSPKSYVASPVNQQKALAGSYLSMLKVAPIPNTQMVQISFTSPDPALSARLANAHAREYIRWGIELNAHESEEAEHFLEHKLEQVKEQLQASEVAVNNYRRDKGIVPGLISVNGKEDVVLERLNKISEDLQAAHLQTISLGTQVSMIKEGQQDALPAVVQSGLVQKLKEELDSDEAEYATLSGKFKPDYPPMLQLERKIKGTRGVMNREISNAVASVKEEYQAAQQRENTLQAELNQQKSFAFGLNDSAVRYLILEREADSNRELYNALLKRVKDLTVIADVHASNVSVVDGAEPPGGPSSPDIHRDAMTAGVLGLAAGIALAFLMDLLDNTLKDSREVERYLRIPSLAMIPEAPKGRALLLPDTVPAEARSVNGLAKYYNGDRAQASVVSYNGRYSILGEAYRNLRTGLMLSRAGTPPKTTLVTSAVPEEGKTTVSVNTAIVLAHAGGRVLLIDADLRIPSCHKRLGMNNARGLTEVLTGLIGLEDAIVASPVENLFFLPAGQTPPNPSELLASPQMRALLEEVAGIYDHIVIDSPPSLPVSDPILLSTLVDGVILVAAGSRTPKQQIKAAMGRLRHAHAKLFGIVLNRIKLHKVDYFFPYYKYYGRTVEEELEEKPEAPGPSA